MKSLNLHSIIFSNDRSYRWKRHALFWLAVFLYHFVRIGLMFPPINSYRLLFSVFENTVLWGLVPNIFVTYTIAYYLIPRYYNRNKYISFILGILVVIAILQTYALVRTYINFRTSYNQDMLKAIGSSTMSYWLTSFRPGFIRAFGNPPLICGLFLSLQILKNWHLEQVKTETLAKENTNAELQLLKAQVHPHFLFNTLNNIYSFSLNQSPLAGSLVRKLSGMLNYMIHECEQPLVPLEKEIKLIHDYMGLEKVRYGNRLAMQVEIEGNCENKMIAPLLMIPFVENCFKHGASIMRGQQWIRLNLHVKEDLLDFRLSNSKPPDDITDSRNKKGIGLANVQKRLQLLYPEKYVLDTESTTDSYSVHLQITLHEVPVTDSGFILVPKLQTV